MKILHITPHMGGGIGTVLMDWMDKAISANDHGHRIMCLDYANEKAKSWACKKGFSLSEQCAFRPQIPEFEIGHSDIVLVHYWDNPMLAELFSQSLPPYRLVFWVHKNYPIPEREIAYPDRCIGTSPIQFLPDYIWSTGDISRFLEIKPKPHKGFNVGYVGTIDYKKIHPSFFDMCLDITARIPGVRFTMVGENHLPLGPWDQMITYVGKVDDIAPYLAEMDVFGYPLRLDHYGTCEQVLGEAMATGIVPVVMDNSCERIICGDSVARSEYEYIRMVEMLYQAPEMRKILSAGVRERAKQLYSLDTMISQWNDVFEEMMKQPKKARGIL